MAAIGSESASASTPITVTTVSDASNGDNSSAQALAANPGPDGISLREAMAVTNNDYGSYAIGFAPDLRGKTITVGQNLPPLATGGVSIEDDIDGDGQPDVTLENATGYEWSFGIDINSSGNQLHGLTLRGFTVGVDIMPLLVQ